MVNWGDVVGAVLQQAFILVVYNLFCIIHAAVADLDGVAVKYFLSLLLVGKCLFVRVRKLRPILLLTFLL